LTGSERAWTRQLPWAGVLTALVGLVLYMALFRLGVGEWNLDELTYRAAGHAYLQGHFVLNPEHPLLAKLLFGVSQLVLGSGAFAVRVVSAIASICIAVGLWAVARRRYGRLAGLGAVLGWALLLHVPPPVSRLALLEPVTTALACASLVFGWLWLSRGTLGWAVACGGFAGLAAGAKLTGGSALLAVLLTAALFRRAPHRLRTAVAAVAAAIVAFLVTYLPAGSRGPSMLRAMIRFQLRHAQRGHPLLIGGHVYQFAPWWTTLYYQWLALGWVALFALVALALVAVLRTTGEERTFVVYLVLAVALPLALLSFSPVQLPHYGYLVQPPMVLLSVVGLLKLCQLKLRRPRLTWLPQIAAAALVVPLAIAGGQQLVAVSDTAPSGYALLPHALRTSPAGSVLVWGYVEVAQAYLGARASANVCRQTGCAEAAVVIDRDVAKRFADPAVAAYLATHSRQLLCRAFHQFTICRPLPRTR
jgi:4-amino-4-deoxy-L-arabinose transferase-like glycosyltransferase